MQPAATGTLPPATLRSNLSDFAGFWELFLGRSNHSARQIHSFWALRPADSLFLGKEESLFPRDSLFFHSFLDPRIHSFFTLSGPEDSLFSGPRIHSFWATGFTLFWNPGFTLSGPQDSLLFPRESVKKRVNPRVRKRVNPGFQKE